MSAGRNTRRTARLLVSIAPPSDVVLDVAQAADPQKVRAATARLVRLGAGSSASGDDFAAELASTQGSSAARSSLASLTAGGGVKVETHKTSPYQKFEAVMLQNFIEEILPKDSDLFGDATSADAYRSMLADQLATQLAKTGRFGVAQSIEHAEARHASEPPPQAGPVQPSGASAPTSSQTST